MLKNKRVINGMHLLPVKAVTSKRGHRANDEPSCRLDDDEEVFFRSDDQQKRRLGGISRPTSAPKKFVMINGVSEVDIGIGPIARSYSTAPIRQNLYAYHRPTWDGDKTIPSHFIVPEIIVTPMSIAGISVDSRPEKNHRRANYVSVPSFSAPSSPHFSVNPATVGTKVQKVGGGGHISIACRKAPR